MDKIIYFFTGIKNIEKFDYKIFFSKSFTNRNKKEIIYFDNLPIPYLWTRVFLFMLGLSLVSFLNTIYVGVYAFPWLTLIAASVIPMTFTVFFYEIMKDKIIGIGKAIIIFFIATTLSLFIVGQINFGVSDFVDTVMIAPLIEEFAKMFTIYIVIKNVKAKKVSQGVFIGFLVGAGFQIAETMGYATIWGINGLIRSQSIDYTVLFRRSAHAFMSHALFGALHGMGIILSIRLKNNVWIKISLLALVSHMAWNFVAVMMLPSFFEESLFILIDLLFIPCFFMLLNVSLYDDKSVIIEDVMIN
ncbi:PrsW family glutamic-type intramembrane protease [Acholeplasma hippikon]|uniref:PrsW family intramembrane metalloprotease n=1 Tax=Acholeplasma hippikon TaxID=264636 RepID=A0A449BID5_9MOLU|nr:PrsW family glutamic-type intramembrane protease [Acholeplasma hippikon]VEU82221.1 Uncharacterised protein [Acholeplasma hippikon]